MNLFFLSLVMGALTGWLTSFWLGAAKVKRALIIGLVVFVVVFVACWTGHLSTF